MITKDSWADQSETSNSERPIKMNRRSLIGGTLAALSFGRSVQAADTPHDPFILLLQGLYVRVPPVPPSSNGPNLGLTAVTLDSTYFRTEIYPVFGISGDPRVAIGNFYVQLAGSLCAYDLPGGAIAMQFL